MIVMKSSVFPAARETVFEKLQKLETLQYIARPYATFEPVGAAKLVWEVGSTSAYRFRLFGVIPFGTHKIYIVRFDLRALSGTAGPASGLRTAGLCTEPVYGAFYKAREDL